MFDDKNSKNWLETAAGQGDILAKAIRIGLSTCGPVGAIVGDFLTEFVPQQRIDRLQDFVEQLAERVHGQESAFEQRLQESASFSALLEAASVAAARSASPQRRKDLAELLRTGLAKEDAELFAHHEVLRLLEALNDAQLLILIGFGSFRPGIKNDELSQFISRHPEVFVEAPTMTSGFEHHRRWEMYRHYEDALETLGLLRDTEGTVKSDRHHRKLVITELGCLVLETIGRRVER